MAQRRDRHLKVARRHVSVRLGPERFREHLAVDRPPGMQGQDAEQFPDTGLERRRVQATSFHDKREPSQASHHRLLMVRAGSIQMTGLARSSFRLWRKLQTDFLAELPGHALVTTTSSAGLRERLAGKGLGGWYPDSARLGKSLCRR